MQQRQTFAYCDAQGNAIVETLSYTERGAQVATVNYFMQRTDENPFNGLFGNHTELSVFSTDEEVRDLLKRVTNGEGGVQVIVLTPATSNVQYPHAVN